MEIKLEPSDLKPIIESVVAELLAKFPIDDGRLAYTEEEIAAMLAVTPTTIRDERLRGRLNGSVVGRKIRITKTDALEYLAKRRWERK